MLENALKTVYTVMLKKTKEVSLQAIEQIQNLWRGLKKQEGTGN